MLALVLDVNVRADGVDGVPLERQLADAPAVEIAAHRIIATTVQATGRLNPFGWISLLGF